MHIRLQENWEILLQIKIKTSERYTGSLIGRLYKQINSSNSKLICSSVQSFSRVRLCNPINRSTPGLPVHHHLPEFTQTHVHRVGDAIQPSHPLSSPAPPAPNPSQHQSLFQCVNSSHEVAEVLEYWRLITPNKSKFSNLKELYQKHSWVL